MGSNRFSDSEVCFSQIPRSKGEGGPKGRVRGEALNSSPLTRPADAGHPPPSGEGFAPKHFIQCVCPTSVSAPENDRESAL